MTDTCENCSKWKSAYQFEHEEHRQTLLMLHKAENESINAFINTRDMVGFMRSLNLTTGSTSSYKPEYVGRKRDANRRKD